MDIHAILASQQSSLGQDVVSNSLRTGNYQYQSPPSLTPRSRSQMTAKYNGYMTEARASRDLFESKKVRVLWTATLRLLPKAILTVCHWDHDSIEVPRLDCDDARQHLMVSEPDMYLSRSDYYSTFSSGDKSRIRL